MNESKLGDFHAGVIVLQTLISDGTMKQIISHIEKNNKSNEDGDCCTKKLIRPPKYGSGKA